MRRCFRLLMTALLLAATGIADAQGDGQVFTFDSGAHFTVPEGGVLDSSDAIPSVTLENSIVVQVIDVATLNQITEIRRNVELADVLDVLLGKVGFEGTRSEDATFALQLAGGRDALVFDFVNSAKNYQSVMVLLMSDGQMAALNIRSLKSLTGAQRDTLIALAASFDNNVSGGANENSAEAALTRGLEKDFAYDSGTAFRYPESYGLINEDKPPVSIGIDNVVVLTMVDPAIVGMPAGESMDDIITFAIKGSALKANTFEPLDIGGREAVIGSAKEGATTHSMILVRFADETVGIMDITSSRVLSGSRLDEVRSIAASFNSSTAGANVPTRADIEQSEALFEQGNAARKAKDYDKAIDLFTQALALDKTFALAYYWRGAAYQSSGELEKALTDFQQALTLKPGESQIHKDIAEVYALLDGLDSAVSEYEAWINASDSSATEEDRALYELMKSVAAGDYNRTFYFARADRLRLMGRFDEALRDNQLSLDNLPSDALLYAQRGVIYMDMEQYPDAVKSFTAGIRVKRLPILFYNRGYANRSNFRNDSSAVIDSAHDFQCLLLLADDSVTAQQREDAQQALDTMIISSDDYAPITDAALCTK